MGFAHWRGELSGATGRQRACMALLLILTEAAIVSTDLSHIFVAPLLYIPLVLAPIAVTGILLGPAWSAAIGLVTGIARFLYVTCMPLPYYEVFLTTPLNSIVLLALCGLLWGLLLQQIQGRGKPAHGRTIALCLSCLLVSTVYSVGYASPALLTDPRAPIEAISGATPYQVMESASLTYDQLGWLTALEVPLGTLCLMLPCVAVHLVGKRLAAITSDINLHAAFRLFFVFVFSITFLAAITISAVSISFEEAHEAEAAMHSDIDYLATQFDYLVNEDDRLLSFVTDVYDDYKAHGMRPSDEQRELLESLLQPTGDYLVGYTMEYEGTVFVVDSYDNSIAYSDDPRLPAANPHDPSNAISVHELLGPDIVQAMETSAESGQVARILYHGVLAADGATDGYRHDTQLGYLLAKKFKEGATIVIIEPASMVFRDRPGVIGREVAMAALLLGAALGSMALLVDGIIVRRINKINAALARITAGELDARATVEGTRELKSLATGINTTVDALNSWIEEAETRMDSELAAARAIQESSLPKELPSSPETEAFDTYATMRAAHEVGGDFYDCFLTDRPASDGSTEHYLVIVVADVSGKGVPASLFMMKAKALIRDAIIRSLREYDPDTLEPVNRTLCEGNSEFMFVTTWAAVINCATGNVRYVNAGHNPPMLRHEGAWAPLKGQSGIPLGMRENVKYQMFTYNLQPGDQLVVYTDGVVEARNDERSFFGDERLLETLAQSEGAGPRELVESVFASVDAFAGNAPQADDITVLALDYHG